ncbi:MAG: hypothetical protein QM635_11825, partial [Microbacteriaceae bacterium]
MGKQYLPIACLSALLLVTGIVPASADESQASFCGYLGLNIDSCESSTSSTVSDSGVDVEVKIDEEIREHRSGGSSSSVVSGGSSESSESSVVSGGSDWPLVDNCLV